jgi:hypothetical protein
VIADALRDLAQVALRIETVDRGSAFQAVYRGRIIAAGGAASSVTAPHPD